MDPSRRLLRGGPLPPPRPRSEFADFTPPAAEPLARLQNNCPISGQFFCTLARNDFAERRRLATASDRTGQGARSRAPSQGAPSLREQPGACAIAEAPARGDGPAS